MFHPGFLADIRRHPDDDTPRLIYADWLEEHGDEAQAEFIRVQIELTNMDGKNPARASLRGRQTALLAAHEKEWVGDLYPLKRSPDKTPWVFRRGFLEELRIDRRSLFDYCAAIAASEVRGLRMIPPPTFSSIRNLTGVIDALNSMPKLQHLDLSGSDLAESEINALARAPLVRRLRSLDLSSNRVGSARWYRRGPLLQILVENPFVNLQTLRLATANVDGMDVEAIASSPQFAKLGELSLAGNDIGDRGVRALAVSRYLQSLSVLNLSKTNLSAGATALIHSNRLEKLSRLDLSGNHFRPLMRKRLLDRFGSGLTLTSSEADESSAGVVACLS